MWSVLAWIAGIISVYLIIGLITLVMEAYINPGRALSEEYTHDPITGKDVALLILLWPTIWIMYPIALIVTKIGPALVAWVNTVQERGEQHRLAKKNKQATKDAHDNWLPPIGKPKNEKKRRSPFPGEPFGFCHRRQSLMVMGAAWKAVRGG